MGKIKKRLYYPIDEDTGRTRSIELYDSVESCPEPNLPIKIKDKTVYAKLGEIEPMMSTRLRVHRDSDNKDYAVLDRSYLTVTINQSPNQTITVTHNGVAHTETFLCPYGDTITSTVVATTAGYGAGDLSVNEVTRVVSNVVVESHGAIPTGSFKVPAKITIPDNISVVQIRYKVWYNSNTINIGVTPGKTYNIEVGSWYDSDVETTKYYLKNADSGVTWRSNTSSSTCYYSADINKETPTVIDY